MNGKTGSYSLSLARRNGAKEASLNSFPHSTHVTYNAARCCFHKNVFRSCPVHLCSMRQSYHG